MSTAYDVNRWANRPAGEQVMNRSGLELLQAAGVLGGCLVLAAIILSVAFHNTGRYQVGGTEGQLCIVDTHTGQVWQKYTSRGAGETDSNWKDPK